MVLFFFWMGVQDWIRDLIAWEIDRGRNCNLHFFTFLGLQNEGILAKMGLLLMQRFKVILFGFEEMGIPMFSCDR